MYIENRVALVTGGASGLGLSFTKQFLGNGIRGVSILDTNEEKGKEVISSLENEFGPNRVIFIKADVNNETEFEDAFRETIEIFKNIDIVVNNAGIANEKNLRKTININLIGVLTGTSLAIDRYLPKYKTFNDPVIVNISSIYGLDGCLFATAYTAAKHGVIGISKSLSSKEHYQETGVKIITICPGFTTTPLTENASGTILPGRYEEISKDILSTANFQTTEVVAKFLPKILDNSNTGDIWIIEDDKCRQVEIPDRDSLKTIRTLEG